MRQPMLPRIDPLLVQSAPGAFWLFIYWVLQVSISTLSIARLVSMLVLRSYWLARSASTIVFWVVISASSAATSASAFAFVGELSEVSSAMIRSASAFLARAVARRASAALRRWALAAISVSLMTLASASW